MPLMRTAINAYRHAPLPPSAKRQLSRWFAAMQKSVGLGERIVQMRGFKLRCDPQFSTEAKVLYTREYEPETVAALEQIVSPGGTCIDVGAHIGIITLTLAQLVGSAGHVHAMEPSAHSFARLQTNLELNGRPSNITATHAAVGSESRDALELMIPHGYRLDGQITGSKQQVRQITLDQYITENNIPHVDLIKTDTDGMEPDVLRGSKRLLTRDHPTVLFEVHPRWLAMKGSTPNELFELFGTHGYSIVNEDLVAIDPVAAAEAVPEGQSVNMIAIRR